MTHAETNTAADIEFDNAERASFEATQTHRTTCPLKITNMSRPFRAKYGGRCPLLGRPFVAGIEVRRIDFTNEETGATFTGIIPVDQAYTDNNTLRLMSWNGAGSAFIRAKADSVERVHAALLAGMTIMYVTKTGGQKSVNIYSFKNQGQARVISDRMSGGSRLTVKAFLRSFTRHAVAWCATGWAFDDRGV